MDCPIPNSQGSLRPEGTGANGVMILGEAMGREEAKDGLPFRPYAQAGAVLERAIRRSGYNRDQFVVWNVVPTHPPNDWLVGAPWEDEAIIWGTELLHEQLQRWKPRAIVALGNVATRVATAMTGPKMSVSYLTGYVIPGIFGIPVIPCFHPSYMRRGKMSHFHLLMRSLKLATHVAAGRQAPEVPTPDSPPPGYILKPTEADAHYWIDYNVRDNPEYVAYDIETAYSDNEEEADEVAAETPGSILSIQFSFEAGSGIYFHWREPFISLAKGLLASPIPKLSWNGWRFDAPRLRQEDVVINGEDHDLMWAWHHLQPDIPRNLQFAAGQLGWPWPWKHLDRANPEFYGIVDVDVLQWMVQ